MYFDCDSSLLSLFLFVRCMVSRSPSLMISLKFILSGSLFCISANLSCSFWNSIASCCCLISSFCISYAFSLSCFSNSISLYSCLRIFCLFMDSINASWWWMTNCSWNCDPLMLLNFVCGCRGMSSFSASLAPWLESLFFKIEVTFFPPSDPKRELRPTSLGGRWLMLSRFWSFCVLYWNDTSSVVNLLSVFVCTKLLYILSNLFEV